MGLFWICSAEIVGRQLILTDPYDFADLACCGHANQTLDPES